MPTPVIDLGDPYINLLHSFWMAIREDLRGEAPIFGHVPSKYRGLPAPERATIERDLARVRANAFTESDDFKTWVDITARITDTEIDPTHMLEALNAGN